MSKPDCESPLHLPLFLNYTFCKQCGSHFKCLKTGECWCFDVDEEYPVTNKIIEGESCLCPQCLRKQK